MKKARYIRTLTGAIFKLQEDGKYGKPSYGCCITGDEDFVIKKSNNICDLIQVRDFVQFEGGEPVIVKEPVTKIKKINAIYTMTKSGLYELQAFKTDKKFWVVK